MPCRFALAASLFAASAGGFSSACSAAQLGDVEHIIVIYLENHSFDNLFGFFPGADGIATAGATKIQVDRNGKPYDFLPPAMEAVDLPHDKEVDEQLPPDLLHAIKKFDKRCPSIGVFQTTFRTNLSASTPTFRLAIRRAIQSIAFITSKRRSTAASWISSSPTPMWAPS
jgi:phospholipase C